MDFLASWVWAGGRAGALAGAACFAAGYCFRAPPGVSKDSAAGPVAAGVRSVAASGSGAGVYETERAVHEYLQFHFCSDIVPYERPNVLEDALGFAQRVAQTCEKHSLPTRRKSALDVGCAVGGSSFELSRTFSTVCGIDYSRAFVAACKELQATGCSDFRALISGDIFENCVARVPEGSNPDRCKFAQGDACALNSCSLVAEHLSGQGRFDCVLAANLLCRLPEPRAFLLAQAALITSGGILVLVSPYSWLPEYTARDMWLGGVRDASTGEVTDSFQEVQRVLASDFELAEHSEMPFLIREVR